MKRLVLAALLLLTFPCLSNGHFIWLLSGDPSPQSLKVFFGESAEPDDPELLDKIIKCEAWAFGGRGEPKQITLEKGKDALEAELPDSARNATIALRHSYGVMSKGHEPFLLKYYAKTYPAPLPGNWRPVNDKERLPLEVVPEAGVKNIKLQVLWQGKPLAKSQVVIVGPGIASKIEGITDEKGSFECELPKQGTYSIRAKHAEEVGGKLEDKEYKSVRNYSTLTLPYVPSRLTPIAHKFPPLPKGTTSFGGAISGNTLYVYGGNYGSAHTYANEDQSGDLWKLDLNRPTTWEKVSSNSRLQGLAMVERDGQLIRIGGFTAQNKPGEKEDLRSQAEVARMTTDGGWETLEKLPEPRSSHDAAIVKDVVYVVGGWNMQGGGKNTAWHDATLAMDLKEVKPTWKTVAPAPFKRRALALASWNGKLYCIGGMQEQGSPTTSVAIYDPASNKWSDGPSIMGNSMDGFGASAFACQGSLYVTTISGSIQRLAQDGSAWEYMGQLSQPRFFHRLLPWNDSKLVVVGGSDMVSGKTEKLELLSIGEIKSATK